MEDLARFFENRVLGTAIVAWFVAQVLKVIIVSVGAKKLTLSRMIGSGGMPSSHAAFVVSLAFAVGFRVGFDSAVFALAAVFAIVVMYDAAGVRRAAGKQAKLLNQIVVDLLEERQLPHHETLKELLGHTPVEVFAGAAVGAFVAAIMM